MEDPMFKHRLMRPSGRSAVLSLVFVLAGTVALAGCGIFEGSDPFAELEVDGDIQLNAEGDTVLYSLTVVNPTNRDLTLTWSVRYPGVLLEVYAVPSDGGGPLWISPGGNLDPVISSKLTARGGMLTLPGRAAVLNILGDSIPPGRYELRVRPNFEEPVPDRGLIPVEFSLGGS
jgi:hypothetical protein